MLLSIVRSFSHPQINGVVPPEHITAERDATQAIAKYLVDALRAKSLKAGEVNKGAVFFFRPNEVGRRTFQFSVRVDNATFHFPIDMEVPELDDQ